jgi:hypothetical protein
MGYHANAAPLDNTSHHNKSMLKSKCAAFRRSKRVKVSSSPEGKPRFYINLSGGSKIKFVIQFHVDKKPSPFSDTEKQTIGKTDDVKSSAARQAWKRAIDSAGEAVSMMAAVFGEGIL